MKELKCPNCGSMFTVDEESGNLVKSPLVLFQSLLTSEHIAIYRFSLTSRIILCRSSPTVLGAEAFLLPEVTILMISSRNLSSLSMYILPAETTLSESCPKRVRGLSRIIRLIPKTPVSCLLSSYMLIKNRFSPSFPALNSGSLPCSTPESASQTAHCR